MKNIVKLLLAFSLFSVIACSEYSEEYDTRSECLEEPRPPVCDDPSQDEPNQDPAQTETPSDNDF